MIFCSQREKKALSFKIDTAKPVELERRQSEAERVIALTPFEKIRTKLARYPKPYWWDKIPDSIPGCFGTYLSEPWCEKCRVKKMCKEQVRHTKSFKI